MAWQLFVFVDRVPDLVITRLCILHLVSTKISQGTTFAAIGRADLASLEMPILPEEQQWRIVEILDTIDEAIQISERLIAKCENVRNAAVARIFGLDTWCLQSDVVTLGQLLASKPRNGYSPDEAPSWSGGWLLGLGCLTTKGFEPRQLKYAPQPDKLLAKARLNDGDLLVSRSNTREMVGLVGQFKDLGEPAYYSDLMMRLVPKRNVDSGYLEAALQSPPARRQIMASAAGTSGSMVKINSRTVMNLRVPFIALEVQRKITRDLRIPTDRILEEKKSLDKLWALRKGLAADLLSGRVRTVKDVESRI